MERKQGLAMDGGRAACSMDHLEEHGWALYEAACGLDLEGIVAKRKDSRYVITRMRS
jgi:ATP-dependent DNA ligase